MAADYRTPGVYINETSAFPPSIAGVPTAVPAFIGYTAQATAEGNDVHLLPVPISSLTDYQAIFGGDAPMQFSVSPDGPSYTVTATPGTPQGYLYKSLQLFFENGGGNCYIVAVGEYTSTPLATDLLAG